METTYRAFHKPAVGKAKADAAESNFGRANVEPHEAGLHWAGGVHQRQNFRKGRDPIVNWTEVLFRN